MVEGRDRRWRTGAGSGPGEVVRRGSAAGARHAGRRPMPRPHRREDPAVVVSRDPRDDVRAARARNHASAARRDRVAPAASPLSRMASAVGAALRGAGRALSRLPRRDLLIGLGAVALLAVLGLAFAGCSRGCAGPGATGAAGGAAAVERPETDQPCNLYDEGRTTASGDGRVTFCAMGDNIMNENLLEVADAAAGTTGDGEYDFSPLYERVAPAVKSYDLSLVNQETTMGGTENFDYMGYPSFNTPDSLADALADAGFKVVVTNSNHTYDTWVPSIEHQQELLAGYPQLVTVGSYASEQDRETPRVVECNGVRVALLAYSYGQNGYEQSDLPNDYYAVPYSDEALAADVARAREVSDFVLVYLHWGDEYTNEPNDEQRRIAQYAADQGVGMVVGSHAHVIQPLEWVERSEGAPLSGDDAPNGGRMLVAYGLGDFASGYFNNPDTIMSGMLTCTLVRGDGGHDDVSVEDVAWHPLVEHWEGGSSTVMLGSDYTPELAARNELLAGLDDPYAWVGEKSREVVGEDFEVVM